MNVLAVTLLPVIILAGCYYEVNVVATIVKDATSTAIPIVQGALKRAERVTVMVAIVIGVLPLATRRLASVRSGTGQTSRPVKEANITIDNVT